MAIAVSYLNENTYINYPLAADQNVPVDVKNLIVDASITFCLPFYCTPVLKNIDITSAGVVTVTLGSTESDDVFATLSGFFIYSNGGSSWRYTRAVGSCGESSEGQENQSYLAPTVCMIINGVKAQELSSTGSWSWSGNLKFDSRVISYEPLRFEKLVLYKDTTPGSESPPIEIYPTYYRQIWFRGGHNVSTTPYKDRKTGITSGIEIAAGPGLGSGLAPCPCEEEQDKKKRSNFLSGNVSVVGDGCVTVYPSPADPSTFIIKDSCTACCQCEQYKARVDTLRGLADEMAVLGSSIRGNIDKLNLNIRNYNRVTKCSEGSWDIVLAASGYNPSNRGVGIPRVLANSGITNRTCYSGTVTVSEFEITGGSPEDGTTQWYVGTGGTSGSDRTGIGLPSGVTVNPGETLKVMRTFKLEDTHIQPYPYSKDFDEVVSISGTARSNQESVSFEKSLEVSSK